jgi:hypothetical protein
MLRLREAQIKKALVIFRDAPIGPLMETTLPDFEKREGGRPPRGERPPVVCPMLFRGAGQKGKQGCADSCVAVEFVESPVISMSLE